MGGGAEVGGVGGAGSCCCDATGRWTKGPALPERRVEESKMDGMVVGGLTVSISCLLVNAASAGLTASDTPLVVPQPPAWDAVMETSSDSSLFRRLCDCHTSGLLAAAASRCEGLGPAARLTPAASFAAFKILQSSTSFSILKYKTQKKERNKGTKIGKKTKEQENKVRKVQVDEP